MRKVTLDEIIENVNQAESNIKEPVEVTNMLKAVAKQIAAMAQNSHNICIKTDYDADGICSAYITEKLLNKLAPNCNVEVECNDRRGSYGLPSDVKGKTDTKYIICDMGSNQLPLAKKALGNDVIIIDHHLIDNDEIKKQFADSSEINSNLCNPHSLNNDDSLNAQYCATGLAYRIYQEISKEKDIHFTEKEDNTLAIIACIGTATDMVNVLDVNSYNRFILKDGLDRINKADETNIDFNLGYILARNGVSDDITAHQLAFNVGAYLNAPSRMSEILETNGAQLMYNALTAKEGSAQAISRLDILMGVNKDRKTLIDEIVRSDEYKEFVNEQMYGENADKNIAIYKLPDNTPHALAGLVAGKLTEATDKAILCVTHKEDGYVGSGRNSTSNETSLKAFMDYAIKEKGSPNLQINYGGHEDAIGISYVNDFELLKQAVDSASEAMQSKPIDNKEVLDITLKELSSEESLKKIRQLEPLGIGLTLPQIVIEGDEQYRDKIFVKGRSDWKRVKVKCEDTTVTVSDWAYNANAYPQSGEGNNKISFLADVGISNYKGVHIEFTAAHSRKFLNERNKEIKLSKSTSQKTAKIDDIAKD